MHLLLPRLGLWLAPMDFLPSQLSGISSSLFTSDFYFLIFFSFFGLCILLDDQNCVVCSVPLNPSCFFA